MIDPYIDYPRVTKIVSIFTKENGFLERWLESPKNQQSAKMSAEFGTDIHKMIEIYFRYKSVNLLLGRENYAFFAKVFLPICYELQDKVIFSEKLLISHKFIYRGTLDLFCDNGIIYDIKTSIKPKKREYLDGYFMQVAAYAAMIIENTDYKVKGAKILCGDRFSQSLQIFELSTDDLKEYFNRFIHYRNIYYYRHNL